MRSLRSAVMALVASAALVLVLAGVTAAVYANPSPPPAVPQPTPGALSAPGAPAWNDGQPPADAPGPAAGQPPADAPPTGQRRVTMRQQPVPTPHHPVAAYHPVSVAPVQNRRPVPPPPSSAFPAPDLKGRTVNTEPCSCDGKLRKVPTHWDPPSP